MGEARVLHYLNQFFAGIGGEPQAGLEPRLEPGPVGPGRVLQECLAGRGTVVGTLICGDDGLNREPERCLHALATLVGPRPADVLVAGPAFNAGRYGVACGRVCAELGSRLGIPAVTAMFPDNPGTALYRREVYILPTGETTVGMRDALARLAWFALRLVEGGEIGPPGEEGYIPRGRRLNVIDTRSAAERAVDLVLRKLRGEPWSSEVPLPTVSDWHAAPPLAEPASARIALVTEGGIVPRGNPDQLESRRASRWRKYPIADVDRLTPEHYECVHGGFDTEWVNKDPHRVLPLDAARELEQERRIGRVHDFCYVTVGCGATIETARRFGQEMAKDLLREGVSGVIMTVT